jgi:flagellar hook-length control protein FliK
MPPAQKAAPTHGQTQVALKDALLALEAAITEVPNQAGSSDENWIKANTTVLDQSQFTAKDLLSQMAASGAPARVEQADGCPMKDHQLDWTMKENMRAEQPEKQITPALSRPVAADTHHEQVPVNRLPPERLSFGKAVPAQPVTGPTKDPDPMVRGLADQHLAPIEDKPSNFKGQDNPSPSPRVALAEITEDDGQKSQPSDSPKVTVAEQTRPHASFQDAAKGLAGDPSTHTAVKPAIGQTAGSPQTADVAIKTFQATVMDQIVDKAAMRSIHGRSEIQIRLKPEFLGNVQMNIATEKELLVVRIMTDRPMVKEIIETHMHQLRTELHNQGLTIDKFEVMVNPDSDQPHSRDQFAQMFKQQSSQNGRRQPHEKDLETTNRQGNHDPDANQPDRDGVNYFA